MASPVKRLGCKRARLRAERLLAALTAAIRTQAFAGRRSPSFAGEARSGLQKGIQRAMDPR